MLLMGAAPSSQPGGASPPGGRSAPAALRGGSPRAGDPVAATLAAAAAVLGNGAAPSGGSMPHERPEGGSGLWVKLIDYEYSTLNDAAYDVANHFCEWAYNYHSGAMGWRWLERCGALRCAVLCCAVLWFVWPCRIGS